MEYEVIRGDHGAHVGTVLLGGVPHEQLSRAGYIYREGFEGRSVDIRLRKLENSLNAFLPTVPSTRDPVGFNDVVTARLMTERTLRGMGSTLARKKDAGSGYLIVNDEKANWISGGLIIGFCQAVL